MIAPIRVRALSIHAAYACRHSGACCTAGWEIPVERRLDADLRLALASGMLAARDGVPLLVRRPGLPDEFASVLGRTADGACVLHDQAAQRCRAHSRLGAAGKPAACRQFPRLLVSDPRGVSLSLSHYCPTAAALLFDDEPLTIVHLPGTQIEAAEGLDVRTSLPPALDGARLADWDTLSAWEHLLVAAFQDAREPGHALNVLDGALRHLRRWRADRGPMADWLRRFAPDAHDHAIAWPADHGAEALVLSAIPEALRPADAGRVTPIAISAGASQAWCRPACRYLAARAFACWPMHIGHGFATQLRYLHMALALVADDIARQVERLSVEPDQAMVTSAIRRADLLLVHLADPTALAAALDADAGEADVTPA